MRIAGVLVLVLSAGICAAQEQPAPDAGAAATESQPDRSIGDQPTFEERLARAEEQLKIRIEPSLWFAGAGGDVRLPRNTPATTPNTKTELPDLNFDNPRLVPLGEVTVSKGDWRVTGRGFLYEGTKESTGNTGNLGDVVFTSTDTLRSSLELGSFELEGAYTVLKQRARTNKEGVPYFATRLDAIAGVRMYDVAWEVERTTGGSGPPRDGESGQFFQPTIGGRLLMQVYNDLNINVQVTMGGMPASSHESYSVDVLVGFEWRMYEHVGVQVGYRSLFFGVGKGKGDAEFEFNGELQGLFGGVVVEF
jgi:hypothetical protein